MAMATKRKQRKPRQLTDAEARPDWTRKCEVCDCTPILPFTGMCGPCTFGEAATANGGWWTEPATASALAGDSVALAAGE